jgi:HSP20 family protein
MSMLTSFDPFFRDFDRLTGGLLGRQGRPGTPGWMPVDAYRHGDEYVVNFDLPGIDPESVDLTVDKNVLSVSAERSWTPDQGDQVVLAERPHGRYSRQLYLSDNLDTGRVEAHYDRGVLSLRIPVSEAAKPRKLQIATGDQREAIGVGANDSN